VPVFTGLSLVISVMAAHVSVSFPAGALSARSKRFGPTPMSVSELTKYYSSVFSSSPHLLPFVSSIVSFYGLPRPIHGALADLKKDTIDGAN
jgi:hypothetical protein